MNCEILAPAGDEQSANSALSSGADAIYLGLNSFSARAGAENFDVAALVRVAHRAHLAGAKVYVALNTLVKDGETASFFSLAREAWNAGADAVLLQDIFLGKRLKEAYPEMVLHLSTQAGCCNRYGAELAKEYGFSRAVLARETPLEEIASISGIIETEVFVQGALCSCFSGQCYLSSFAGNHSGNRGRCKQPCRKRYSVDRAGYGERAYAISLSDLSVGARVKELIAAGVRSLKIEGRMRRPEYVASAVEYYRALLDGARAETEFSRMKRAYNRGDYTAGLAFGQDKNFLSRDVQGHVGECVGEVRLRGGKAYCKSAFRARKGDCFKILRGGKEVCGATFSGADDGGFYLSAPAPLRAGDSVRVTTDTEANRAALSVTRLREIPLTLRFVAGEAPRAESGTFGFSGGAPLERANRAPLTREELEACFCKTDGLPFSPKFVRVETENAFLSKSELNAFRRAFYKRLSEALDPARVPLEEKTFSAVLTPREGGMSAVIATDLTGMSADILIYKPSDYADMSALSAMQRGHGAKYLYLPPFFTERDERAAAELISHADGLYCEGTYGLILARKYHKPLFAGTGFNLTNAFAVAGVKEAGAQYFALSKELTEREQHALAEEGAFALTVGSVKVMDLVYCPFERNCASCDRRSFYTLKDEEGREFPLRRYRVSGSACRFEVYNCASLAAYNGVTSALADVSAEEKSKEIALRAKDPEQAKRYMKRVTKGHADRSLL